MKKVLILGGSRFIGKHVVSQMLQNEGYQISIFNRGTHKNPFPEVEHIKGDRETDGINQILGRDWDTVMDFSGYLPDSLETLMPKLEGRVGKYIYVSTVSVYGRSNTHKALVTEDCGLVPCSKEQRKGDLFAHYGAKKAECERIILNSSIDSVFVRPSIVFGADDYTERFYYWIQRIQTQKRILLPEGGIDLGTLTYVEDLAKLMITMIQKDCQHQSYNAVFQPVNTLKEKLELLADIMNKTIEWEHISMKMIKEKGLKPSDFPIWTGNDYLTFSGTRVLEEFGTDFHSLEDSYKKTIASCPDDWREATTGLRAKDEKAILESLS